MKGQWITKNHFKHSTWHWVTCMIIIFCIFQRYGTWISTSVYIRMHAYGLIIIICGPHTQWSRAGHGKRRLNAPELLWHRTADTLPRWPEVSFRNRFPALRWVTSTYVSRSVYLQARIVVSLFYGLRVQRYGRPRPRRWSSSRGQGTVLAVHGTTLQRRSNATAQR